MTDSGGLTTNGLFTITVQDTTAPTLVGMPDDMTVEGNTTDGADVTWTDPTATDIVDASPTVSCLPASGSFFALGGPHAVTCTATDGSSNSSSASSFNVTVVDTTPPIITCPADFNGTVGQPVSLGSPTVSDIVDASPSVSNNAPATFPPGSTTVTWTATDASGNFDSCTQQVTLTYNWNGFFRPVDNLGTFNQVKAGSAIPVKFSLSGNQGLNIFAAGYPKSAVIICDATAPVDGIDETVTAGNSSLSYDPLADQYVYVWKTEKSWTGCRQLTVRLNDGTDHKANFKFK